MDMNLEIKKNTFLFLLILKNTYILAFIWLENLFFQLNV